VADPIYDVYWEGPYAWDKRQVTPRDRHVLYAIYGTHRVYGPQSLLYIGRTESSGGKRLKDHDWWVKEESAPVSFHLASIGEFKDWPTWESIGAYPKATRALVQVIESLLIHAHQPAYNAQSLQAPAKSRPFRVFNTGHYGSLLPEVSYRYYADP